VRRRPESKVRPVGHMDRFGMKSEGGPKPSMATDCVLVVHVSSALSAGGVIASTTGIESVVKA
jgi:hypothetical protein